MGTFLLVTGVFFLIVSTGVMAYYSSQETNEGLSDYTLVKAGLMTALLLFITWFLMFLGIFYYDNPGAGRSIEKLFTPLILIGLGSFCLSIICTILVFGASLYNIRKLKQKDIENR